MKEFPKVGGIVGMFRDAILSISRSNQEELALGAAIALGGVLASNRFSHQGRPVYTTMYILNVARTGSGKGAAYDFINALFSPRCLGTNPHFNLLGLRNYSSDVAIIGKLQEQRTRLDVIDEFGQVFKGLAARGDRRAAVGDCLKILFSAKGWFAGHHTKTSGTIGACQDPAISLLGAIQPETLINNSDKEVLFDGFMGRFMYFIEGESAEWSGNHLEDGLDQGMLDTIANACFAAYPNNPLIERDIIGNLIADTGKMEFTRQELTIPTPVRMALIDMDRAHYYEVRKKSNLESALFSRAIEHTDKLAKILCVSYGERTLKIEHLEEAKAVVDACMSRSLGLLQNAGTDKEVRNGRKILEFLKRESPGQIPGQKKRSAVMQFCNLSAREMREAVEYLTAMGLVEEIKLDTRSNAASYLCLPGTAPQK